MRATLVSYGSTGDVRPLVALALGLSAAGHEAVLVGDGSGTDLAASHGLEFHALPGDLRDQLAPGTPLALTAEAGHFTVKSFRDHHYPHREWLDTMTEAASGSQVVVCMPMAASHALAVARDVGARPVVAVLQPLAPTREFVPAGIGTPRLPGFLNRPVGRLVEFAGWRLVASGINRRRRELGLPRISDPTRGAQTLCAWSPTLVPRPADWASSQFAVTGRWGLPADPSWRPDADLQSFLDAGEPPVYVGFGSMPPVSWMPALLDALLTGLAGRRVLLSAGWARLDVGSLPSGVFPLGFAPHDWLFPRCAAVVHHCGAGTTHAAAAAGVPTIAVPMTLDQPFWAERLARLGIGTRPIDPRNPDAGAVWDALREAGSVGMGDRAAAVAERMASEDGVASAVARLEQI